MNALNLALGFFFNPLGFDVCFAAVLKMTGSLWVTDFVFYSLAAFHFGSYWVGLRYSKKLEKKIAELSMLNG